MTVEQLAAEFIKYLGDEGVNEAYALEYATKIINKDLSLFRFFDSPQNTFTFKWLSKIHGFGLTPTNETQRKALAVYLWGEEILRPKETPKVELSAEQKAANFMQQGIREYEKKLKHRYWFAHPQQGKIVQTMLQMLQAGYIKKIEKSTIKKGGYWFEFSREDGEFYEEQGEKFARWAAQAFDIPINL